MKCSTSDISMAKDLSLPSTAKIVEKDIAVAMNNIKETEESAACSVQDKGGVK